VRAGAREETMNLKNAFLCIDCDEVFAVEESSCNPRCPNCASSVFVPLSAWVQTWTTLEKLQGDTNRTTRDGASAKRLRLEIIHSTAIAV
jgi:DNA-directed RNA polymerase subunit RPC12/RpoP